MKKETYRLCVYLCLLYIYGLSLDSLGRRLYISVIMALAGNYIEKKESSSISQRAKSVCSRVTKRAQLSPLRCSEAEMALQSCLKLG